MVSLIMTGWNIKVVNNLPKKHNLSAQKLAAKALSEMLVIIAHTT